MFLISEICCYNDEFLIDRRSKTTKSCELRFRHYIAFLPTRAAQDEERRFRVRFTDQRDPQTGKSACRQCIDALAPFVLVDYADKTVRYKPDITNSREIIDQMDEF